MTDHIVIDEAAFRRDWDAGLTLVELAAIYGVSESTVSSRARRFGCPQRQSGRKSGGVNVVDNSPRVLTDGEWVADGSGVMRWEANPEPAKRPVVKRPPRTVIDEDEFRQLWDFGLTVATLAERYRCSRNRISNLARRLGCPYRTRQHRGPQEASA